MEQTEIRNWLQESDGGRLDWLYRRADLLRREQTGAAARTEAHVEFSNYCAHQCGHCGLRRGNRLTERYRLNADQILDCARLAAELSYTTLVLQSGVDYGVTTEWMAGLIRRIKSETGLAITLNVGEYPEQDLAAWREAGADGFRLRLETTDAELYQLIHPPFAERARSRMEMLRRARELGYQIGSGVLVGIPGQSYASLAEDMTVLADLQLDVLSMASYVAHPETPLGRGEWRREIAASEQVPNTMEMLYRVMALTRLENPTARLASIEAPVARELSLARGANLIAHNLTPAEYHLRYRMHPVQVDHLAANLYGKQPTQTACA